MLPRTLNLPELLAKKSHFLFGPRGTGKTTLIREQLLDSAFRIDLLNSDYYVRLAARPAELEQIIASGKRTIVAIDEVQKLPIILDEVHRLIEEKQYRFLLTGSSARKLKRGGANLLAGRAWLAELMPLTSHEIHDFSLDRYLRFGGLPAVYYSEHPAEELSAYIRTYLTEEIAAEGLVRELPLFSRFLTKCGQSSGALLNFTELGSDLGVSPTTVREYYRILEDTLIGFMVEPFRGKRSRKEVATSKFYFFDVGVASTLLKATRSTEELDNPGLPFEQFIVQEVRAALRYLRIDIPLMFWRTHDQAEVDLVLPHLLALEIKSTRSTNRRMAKGLHQIAEHYTFKRRYLVSHDPVRRIDEGVEYVPYEAFLRELWAGELFADG